MAQASEEGGQRGRIRVLRDEGLRHGCWGTNALSKTTGIDQLYSVPVVHHLYTGELCFYMQFEFSTEYSESHTCICGMLHKTAFIKIRKRNTFIGLLCNRFSLMLRRKTLAQFAASYAQKYFKPTKCFSTGPAEFEMILACLVCQRQERRFCWLPAFL